MKINESSFAEMLGFEMKNYEKVFAGAKLSNDKPICVRLDGKGFSKYTKKFKKPFDEDFSKIMQEVTKFLIQESNAVIGYTQSDEITLILFSENNKENYFNGKIQKLVSVLASMATAKFNQLILNKLNVEDLAFFDCRVWEVPNKAIAANVLYWREIDATKNSVSMATRVYYTTSEMKNKKASEMKEMLRIKGVEWNDYPTAFKRGAYFQKKETFRFLTESELSEIPEKYQPNGKVKRTEIVELNLPPISQIKNKIDVIFDKKQYIL